MQMMREDIQRLSAEYENKIGQFSRDRSELVNRIAELSKIVDRTRDELVEAKTKGRQYKEKLRLANTAIKQLGSKVMQYEQSAERVGGGGGGVGGNEGGP